MYKEELEIRGTHRTFIVEYIHELGGILKNESGLYYGENWECYVSDEQYFRFLQSDVPKVLIFFTSEDENSLKEVVRKFRLKTFRAGG